VAGHSPRRDRLDATRGSVGFVLFKVAVFPYRSHSASDSYSSIGDTIQSQ
jgi:hypothetical protein